MCRQKWIIFLFITNIYITQGQISDAFDDLSGELSEFWLGDRTKFRITPDHKLQLKDNIQGKSSLYGITEWQEEQVWEFLFFLDFDPSNNNRLEVYLWSDDTNLSEGSGVLIRIGENGNQDALTLFDQVDGSRTEIATGTMGLAARGPVVIRINAYILNDILVVEADYAGNTCFLAEIEAPVTPLKTGDDFFFGWTCISTKTKSDLFYLDDIYIGSLRPDVSPPELIQFSYKPSEVNWTFSESIDLSTLPDATINLTPTIKDLEIVLKKNDLTLTSPSGFSNELTYQLMLSGLSDLSGNRLDTTFGFIVPSKPIAGDILINEILFNPIGSGSDYIELFNDSRGAISFSRMKLLNENNQDEIFLTHLPPLEAGGIVAITDDVANITARYPNNDADRIYELDIPRFNNEKGNVTISVDQLTIDAFDYDEEFHHPLIDQVEGISLERIATHHPTEDATNWTSALASAGYGTPGLANSVATSIFYEKNDISLDYTVFSPNDDGDKDDLIIRYALDHHGYLGSFRIYNDHGILIRTISLNELLSSTGHIKWDGRDDDGTIAPIGIYLIHASLFNLEGQHYQKKLSCGLGNFLN